MNASDLIKGDEIVLDGKCRKVRYAEPCIATRETTLVLDNAEMITLPSWQHVPVITNI